MTNRELMQQALDAMLNNPDDISDEMFESIKALKERLAQANEFEPDWDAMAVMVEEQQRMAKRIEELEAQALHAAPQAPIHYYRGDEQGNLTRSDIHVEQEPWVKTYAGGKPNYTTPEEPGVTLDASAPLVVQPHPAFQSQPPVQEPVATVTSESGNPNVSMSWWHEPALPVGTNIYTSPQPSKPWVGLTDEEIAEMHNEIKVRLMGTYRTEDIYRAIEAKLKKKNT